MALESWNRSRPEKIGLTRREVIGPKGVVCIEDGVVVRARIHKIRERHDIPTAGRHVTLMILCDKRRRIVRKSCALMAKLVSKRIGKEITPPTARTPAPDRIDVGREEERKSVNRRRWDRVMNTEVVAIGRPR